VTLSASWGRPTKLGNRLVDWVARAPGRVQSKLLAAFLTIAGLLVVVSAVALSALSGVNDQTQQLIKLQREIAAYRQVQQDTTSQLYGIASALLFPDDPTLDAALRQLNQFGYDLDRLEFVARHDAELIVQVRLEYAKMVDSATRVAELVRAGKVAEAREVQTNESVPQADRVQRLTNQLVNIAEADMVAAIDATRSAYHVSQIIVVAFSVGSVLLALALGYVISWSLIRPVRAIEGRLTEIAAGEFAGRVEVANHDELGALAANVNQTSRELGRLYNEVQTRTRELAHSVEELRALGEVSQAVNSTLDLETVLSTIVAKAVPLSGTDAGAIYVYSKRRGVLRLRATYGMSEEFIAAVKNVESRFRETPLGEAIEKRAPVQIADLRATTPYPVHESILEAGFKALLIVPLLGPESVVGALVVRRREPGRFADSTVDLLKTFAAQSVLAIQNARLFSEIEEKGRQLEIASRHKSQFLANMSHELRTPLNAILGYTELILDSIYGEPTEKMRGVLNRVESNGRHLLGLINDVLDLSKIEAGQLSLALADYSLSDVVQSVFTAVEPLANEKRLALKVELPQGLPVGHGDERRIAQVLLNLVGTAIKFTDEGEVAIEASASNGSFEVAVRDTGPGVSEADQEKIFEEFQQADNSSTRKKGGTGLGLAISKRIIEMHGGRLSVRSALGQGSVFSFALPVVAKEEVRGA
jgi:signal transduction histidine kinase/HAMP domain-containing protein